MWIVVYTNNEQPDPPAVYDTVDEAREAVRAMLTDVDPPLTQLEVERMEIGLRNLPGVVHGSAAWKERAEVLEYSQNTSKE
jgi:hypothetical protein